jgi:hypothetical protein
MVGNSYVALHILDLLGAFRFLVLTLLDGADSTAVASALPCAVRGAPIDSPTTSPQAWNRQAINSSSGISSSREDASLGSAPTSLFATAHCSGVIHVESS